MYYRASNIIHEVGYSLLTIQMWSEYSCTKCVPSDRHWYS